jgi:hypothetical protein
MQFESANPSVVRSIKQRDLLNAWLRTRSKYRALPVRADYRPDRIADELAEMMGFDVEGGGDNARFLITQEGSRLTATYGNEHIAPDKRTNRYLDDAIGPARYARVVPSYQACVTRKRPTYSISMVQDPDGRTFPMSGCCCRSEAARWSSRSSAPTRRSASTAGSRSIT